MFHKFQRIHRRTFSLSAQRIKEWLQYNNTILIGGSVFSGITFALYYNYKRTNCINLRLVPAIPSTGITMDFEKLQFLTERYSPVIKKKGGLKYLCFYGKIGCGKSILASEFCKRLVEQKRSIFGFPSSKIIAFLNCSSKESFCDSLLSLLHNLEKAKEIPLLTGYPDLDDNKVIEMCFQKLKDILKDHKDWIIVWDNINDEAYEELQEIFRKYLFSEDFKGHHGTFLLLCDTNDPLIKDDYMVYKVSGLSLQAAMALFMQHSGISAESLSLSDPEVNGIMHLIHTQPLSVISFAMMVKENLKKLDPQSIKSAIKQIEVDVMQRVKDAIESNGLKLTPSNFESLYARTVFELAIHQSSSQNHSHANIAPILHLISFLDPLTPVPETLITKLLINLNLKHCLNSELSNKESISGQQDQGIPPNILSYAWLKYQWAQMKRGYDEIKQLYESMSIPLIPPESKLGSELKSSPFINIVKTEDQDLLCVHPLVYQSMRHKFISESFKIFFHSMPNGQSSVSLLNRYFGSTINRLSEMWSLSIEKSLSITSNQLSREDNFCRQKTISWIFDQLSCCLAHNDPVCYPNRLSVDYKRIRHLTYIFTDLMIAAKQVGNASNLTKDDRKYMLQLIANVSLINNKLKRHANTIRIIEKSLSDLGLSLDYEDAFFKNEFILMYLSIIEAQLGKGEYISTESYYKVLWSLISPYRPPSEPLFSARLLQLCVQYTRVAGKRIVSMDNLDLMCHSLQKFNLAVGSSFDGVDQLAEIMMDIYFTYGEELIFNRYFDYADHLIRQADKFNNTIFKKDHLNLKSPYDSSLMELKFKLELLKGNLAGVDALRRSVI